VNPKTVKLQHGLVEVATPYLAVLDDDTVLAADSLGRAVFALRSCSLYTGLPCYLSGDGFWSALVAYFVNNNSILTYLPLLPLVGPLTINGMFYVMRTQTVKDMDGFTPILDQLCDDYALARHVRAHGGVIRQAATPHYLRTTVPGPGPYFRLMHRWFVFARVLASDQPARVVLLLVVFLGLPPLLLWLGLLSLFGGLASGMLLATTLVLRHLALRRLHGTVLGGLSPFSPLMSILAELLQPLHALHACLQSDLRWRTRRIQLESGGTFSYLPGGSP
jgi:ceramide glucosyltransferase